MKLVILLNKLLKIKILKNIKKQLMIQLLKYYYF